GHDEQHERKREHDVDEAHEPPVDVDARPGASPGRPRRGERERAPRERRVAEGRRGNGCSEPEDGRPRDAKAPPLAPPRDDPDGSAEGTRDDRRAHRDDERDAARERNARELVAIEPVRTERVREAGPDRYSLRRHAAREVALERARSEEHTSEL